MHPLVRQVLPGRLLAVDDSALNRTLLSRELMALGHEVEGAENGRVALEMLSSKAYDLMLLDLEMPEMDGHEVLDKLRQDDMLRDLPVIVISSHEDVSVAAKCIEIGAEDYLNKPFNSILLQARVSACLEKKRLRAAELELRRDLELRNNELERLNTLLEEMAFTDPLTRLPNRRYAMRSLEQLWEIFQRKNRVFSCVLCDVDHFKRINDNFGHDCGDSVLTKVAGNLRHQARTADMVCRYGGEEFLIICPETDLDGAGLLAERLRQSIETCDFDYEGFNRRITATFGVGQAEPSMERLDTILKIADDALYRAKEAGRNRVGVGAG